MGRRSAQSRNNSLIDVFARVVSSTRLTITAQYKFGPNSPFLVALPGSEPGTTRETARPPPPNYSPVPRTHTRGGGPKKTPKENPGPSAQNPPSATPGARPKKKFSSRKTGPRLQRLEHTADAGAAGDVTVLAD